MKHTATPWMAAGRAIFVDGKTVAVCSSNCGNIETLQANAQFIVKACNHHEELVDALEGMVDTFKTLPTKTNRQQDALDEAIELLTKIKNQ